MDDYEYSIWELYNKLECPTLTDSIGAVAGVVAPVGCSAAGSSI